MAKQDKPSPIPIRVGRSQCDSLANRDQRQSESNPPIEPIPKSASKDSMPEMESTLDRNADQDILGAADILELVDQHHAQVYRYAFRLAGNQADAEDLTQQTFLIAHQKLSQLRESTKAAGWLLTIARSCFLKSIRRTRPTAETSLQISIDQIPREGSSFDAIDRMALQEALLELPEDHRVIVLMFYFENLSYKEIAEQLGVKIGTVMSRLSRAKVSIRQSLLAKNR